MNPVEFLWYFAGPEWTRIHRKGVVSGSVQILWNPDGYYEVHTETISRFKDPVKALEAAKRGQVC